MSKERGKCKCFSGGVLLTHIVKSHVFAAIAKVERMILLELLGVLLSFAVLAAVFALLSFLMRPPAKLAEWLDGEVVLWKRREKEEPRD